MRLAKLVHGHGLVERLKLGFIRLVSGRKPADVVNALLYRPKLWGGPFCDLTQAVMRGPGAWHIGEREIMAAYVSKLNQCVF
jgi:hypothetical protein